ncbi:hypothetical protein [Rhizobium sp. FKL33]|uniref:hypothetical protein n=1 Tax=Rhizobium sp. FKL33 TaxID=2562307 RepID=UPI0010BFB676|nr:hypothetical protein [Rhizobium sp. FKL33]
MEAVAPDNIDRILSAPKRYQEDKIHSLHDRLKALIALPEVKVVSFDCFDTLIKRSANRPIEIFGRIGEALRKNGMLPAYIDNHRFKDWRIRAEQSAREKMILSGSHEVNLSQIYNELEKLAGGAISVKDFIKCELEIEKNCMFFNQKMIEIVDYAKKLGKKVIVVSDTYYTSGELQFITGLGTIDKIDRFYASSEFGTGKGGTLFEIVLKNEKVNAYEMLHIGDNFGADVERPISYGIRTCLVPNGAGAFWGTVHQELKQPTLERRYWESSGIGAWHGRLTSIRSLRPLLDEPNTEVSYYSFGFEILGPVLFSYLKWVEDNVKSLANPLVLGLLREGGFLSALYRTICPNQDVRLLALSRRTLNQMELRKPSAAALTALMSARRREPLDDFLAKIGLNAHALPAEFRSAPIGTDGSGDRVIEYILSNETLISKVKSFGEAVTAQFEKYVGEAEGDKKYDNIVFLDLGWAASIQRKVDKHPVFQDRNTVGFYLALNNHAFSSLQTSNVAGFLINGFDWGEVEDMLMRYVEILEQVCTPEIGSTAGYLNGKSLHSKPSTNAEQLHQIAMLQAGIIDFVELANDAYGEVEVEPLREAALRILSRFTFAPTPNEKEMFRSWNHDDSIIDSHDPMTPEYLDDIEPYMAATQILEGKFLYWYWPQGAKGFGHDNPDLQNLLPFGIQAVRERESRDPFARMRWNCGGERGALESTATLNSKGRFYVEMDAAGHSGELYLDVQDINGFFMIEEIYFYVNCEGERKLRKGHPEQVQILDAEYSTRLGSYAGEAINATSAKNSIFKIEIPTFPNEVVEAVSLCCIGAITQKAGPSVSSTDFEIHFDKFASTSEFDEEHLEKGIPVAGQLVFDGWAYETARLCKADTIMIQLEFVDDLSETVPSASYHAERKLRADVSQSLQRLMDFDIGFRVSIPLSDVNRRAFKMYLKLKIDGGWLVKPIVEDKILLANAGRFFCM